MAVPVFPVWLWPANAQQRAPVKVRAGQVTRTVGTARHGGFLHRRIDIKDLRSLLRVEIPCLALVKYKFAGTVSAMSLPNFPRNSTGEDLRPAGKAAGGNLLYAHRRVVSFLPPGRPIAPGGQRKAKSSRSGEALL